VKSTSLLKCLICGSKDSVILRQHSYSYRQCKDCGHSLLNSNERGSTLLAKNQFVTEVRKKGEIIQGTLTQPFYDRTDPINQDRLGKILPFLKGRQRVLDVNAQDGSMVKLLGEKGFSSQGISSSDLFQSYWDSNTSQRKLSDIPVDKPYDVILMFDYLEYSYCPGSEVLDAYARLKPDGVIIAILSTDNDLSDFKGRTHEFSKLSAKKFAQEADLNAQVIVLNNQVLLVLHRGLRP
jgi:2-polyprenyl-3-methyl-5-hydroxy-6-metoxy-1,4-benzoquinol methylase/DNA-directed RNA polymerase subunit RPC12/RpoP